MRKSAFVIACCAVCALFVPVVRAQTVVVQPGDVLGTIAERELGSPNAWRVLCDLNTDVLGGDCNRVVPGMVLTLPGGTVGAPAPVADPTVIVSPITGETIRLRSFAADIDEAVAAVTAEPPAQPDAGTTVAEPDTAPVASPPVENTEPSPEPATETVQAVAPQPVPEQPSPAPVVAPETVSVPADSAALPVSPPAPDTQQPERAAVLDLPKTDPALAAAPESSPPAGHIRPHESAPSKAAQDDL